MTWKKKIKEIQATPLDEVVSDTTIQTHRGQQPMDTYRPQPILAITQEFGYQLRKQGIKLTYKRNGKYYKKTNKMLLKEINSKTKKTVFIACKLLNK